MARTRKNALTARTADRHVLYEKSVQCPECDVAFLDRVFRKRYGRHPESLLEDFCGTATLCREWVQSRRGRTAVGVDLDAEVLDWGRRHNVEPLGEDAGRIQLVRGDVRHQSRRKVDVRVGFNFSYFILEERRELVRYFRAARKSLNPEGLFVLDILGGPDAQAVLEESREIDGFDYVWDQAAFNPIDHHMRCLIHFDFPDGTRMRNAFVYEWRLWSLMEIRDALAEAGFSESEVYWEGTDRETGEGNGVYTRRRMVENEDCWVSYVVAVP